MSVPLSVLVLTKNEERNIGACLDSIAGWAADIVVVDSGSEDRTLDLCAVRGVRTVFHAYADHRSQIGWGMTGIPWEHEWLLLLDADNVVTPELKADIERMLRNDQRDVNGYYNPHHHYFRNRRVRGLKPESAARLPRADRVPRRGGFASRWEGASRRSTRPRRG